VFHRFIMSIHVELSMLLQRPAVCACVGMFCRSLKGLNVYRHVLFIIIYYIYFFSIFRCPRRAGANEKNRIGLLFPAAAAASTDRTNRGATIAADATVRPLWYSRQAPRRPHAGVRSYASSVIASSVRRE